MWSHTQATIDTIIRIFYFSITLPFFLFLSLSHTLHSVALIPRYVQTLVYLTQHQNMLSLSFSHSARHQPFHSPLYNSLFSLSLWQRHKQTSTVQNWELWCRYKLSGLMQFWVFHFKTLKPFIIFWVLLLLLCSYHQNKIIMICCLCDSAISCVGSKFRITNAFDVTLGNIEIWKK